MNKRAKYVFHKLLSRTHFTFFWEFLYKISLKGLNYGYSDSPRKSGEQCVLEMLKRKVPCSGDAYMVVNVGANFGQYLTLLKRIIPNSRAILFEPSLACFKELSSLNDDSVVVYNLALGDREGRCELFFEAEGSVLGSLVAFGEEDSYFVDMATLDGVLDKDAEIDLLVIDTEGFEKNVLLGAANLIAERKVKMIQFEHGSIRSILNQTFLRDFFEILEHYEIFHIKQNGIVKISYVPEKEIFSNTNYLAILKTDQDLLGQ